MDKGNGMKKALLCATAAATMVSAGATAHAQTGWYGTGRIGAVVDGIQDVDAASGVNGQIDSNSKPEVDPVYGASLGYGFGNGLRVEGAVTYRNVNLDVPDTFIGTKPLGTVGPQGDGSTRATSLMANLIKEERAGRARPLPAVAGL